MEREQEDQQDEQVLQKALDVDPDIVTDIASFVLNIGDDTEEEREKN